MNHLQKHVRMEHSAAKACTQRGCDLEGDAFLDRYVSNRYAARHEDQPDICFWSCTFLDDTQKVRDASYSILGSIPVDGRHSAVWFDTTLVHTDLSSEEFTEHIEELGHGFEVSSIVDGNSLKAEVFVRFHCASHPLRSRSA